MTLRKKLVIAFATVAIVVALLVGAFTYGLTAHNLRVEVDRSLAAAAGTLSGPGSLSVTAGSTAAANPPVAVPATGGFIPTARVISVNGSISQLSGVDVGLPVSAEDKSLASSGSVGTRLYEDVTVGDQSFRVLTQSLGNGGGAIQVARDLSETSRLLGTLAFTIVVVGLMVLLVAAVAGWLVARQITRRLIGLTEVAERVSSTGQLDVEIPAGSRDEVGRLSTSLQMMLAELARSRDDQHRLVQNAGHELRTPLTSLRTNVSVMQRFDELSPSSRRRLLDDVDGETRELTNLVNELVELATDRRDAEQPEPVDLSALARRTAERYRRRSDRTITVDAGASVVLARPQAVERALSNLLDNAVKFDPDGADPIEIRVHGATVEVLDRGPGVDPADADRIFDRFYRADTARSMPGSGLGLSIVREVAVDHGGTVSAATRPGGGAVIGFTVAAKSFLPESNPQPAGG